MLVVDTTSRPRLASGDEALDNVEAYFRSFAVLAGRRAVAPCRGGETRVLQKADGHRAENGPIDHQERRAYFARSRRRALPCPPRGGAPEIKSP